MFCQESVLEVIDAEMQSCFFHFPVEIRRHIYSYIVDDGVHLYLHNGRICISTCITPKPSDDYFCFDRRSLGDPSTEVWARRLESSWALHWRCEEVAFDLGTDQLSIKSKRDPARALMQSCKQIYEEVAYLVAEKAVIHVTDLATLNVLLTQNDQSASGSNFTHSLPINSFSGVRRLRLSLRLPLQVYKIIELQSNQGMPLHRLQGPAAMWMSMWPAIAKLQHLQSLQVYLDHDSEASWSLVDEDAILSTLLPLSLNSNLSTTISMPALPQPKDTKGNSESSSDDSPSNFHIQRFTRQRLFTERRTDGSYGVVYEDDANSMFHDPSSSADELARTAEMTMHVWLHGIELDYCEMMSESLGGGC